MNCLNSLLSKDGAISGLETGARNIAGVDMGVLLLSVRIAPASSSSQAGGEFQQRLRQAQGLTIVLAG